MSEGRTGRVTLTGALDVSCRERVEAALPAPGSIDQLVIDCSGVTAIDSTILTLFMRYRRNFQEAGGDPLNIVVVANDSVRRMFEIAGLSRSLTVIPAAGER